MYKARQLVADALMVAGILLVAAGDHILQRRPRARSMRAFGASMWFLLAALAIGIGLLLRTRYLQR